MKRALLLVCAACAGGEKTPRTEVAIAPQSATSTSRASAVTAPDAGDDDDLLNMLMNADAGPHTESEAEEDALLNQMMNQGNQHAPPVVVLADGTTETDGQRAIVRRVVRQNFGKLRACYDKGLAAKPGLAGRVVVRFTIDPAGKVAKTESTSATTLPSADVSACVATAFKSFVFPQPRGGSWTVDYPIVFPP